MMFKLKLTLFCIWLQLLTEPSHQYQNTTSDSIDSVRVKEENLKAPVYRFKNSKNGQTCILMKTRAMIEVIFSLNEEDNQVNTTIPDKAFIDGSCVNEDAAILRISWSGYILQFNFAKTPGGESWYISSTELTINPDLPSFQGIKTFGNSLKLYHKEPLIMTPVGRSCYCKEITIELLPEKEDHPPSGLRGMLLLKQFQIQPFMYRHASFEQAFECKRQRNFRSESAPIAVGSTLAIAAVATVSGYGAFRYFKVKNFQYDSMH